MYKLLLTLVLLSGCSSSGVNRADQNKITKEFYASIESIRPVKLSSNVKNAIVSGAVIGVIDELDGNHKRMIAGGIAGALVGGILTALFEGSNKAYEYKLKSKSEGEFTLIQKDKIDTHTGCAKIKVSNKASIYSASKENCTAIY